MRSSATDHDGVCVADNLLIIRIMRSIVIGLVASVAGVLGWTGIGYAQESKLAPSKTEVLKYFEYKMIAKDGGTFTMGADDGELNARPAHEVTLEPYYIGESEVSQKLWKLVMGNNPSGFTGSAAPMENLPVENVSWDEALVFIQRLNQITNETYRLPTEAEWEFAAKDEVSSSAHCISQSKLNDIKTEEVQKVTVMVGNVWEWCQDEYASYPGRKPEFRLKNARVIRGGSWYDNEMNCQPKVRGYFEKSGGCSSVGFRLAKSKKTGLIFPGR